MPEYIFLGGAVISISSRDLFSTNVEVILLAGSAYQILLVYCLHEKAVILLLLSRITKKDFLEEQ